MKNRSITKKLNVFLAAIFSFFITFTLNIMMAFATQYPNFEVDLEKNLPRVLPLEVITVASAQPMIRLLDEIDADPMPSATKYNGKIASLSRDPEVIKISSIYWNNKTMMLLALAAKYNHLPLLEKLLKKNPRYDLIASKIVFRIEPLNIAIENKNSEAAQMLLSAWGPSALKYSSSRPLVTLVKVNLAKLVEQYLDAGSEWDSFFDGDPVVFSMTLGHRDIAKIFMRRQGVYKLKDNQANKIFSDAIEKMHMEIAEAMAGSITKADQKALYYAAAFGKAKLLDKLILTPGVDSTIPADRDYFPKISTKGKSVDEVAAAFGHKTLAEELGPKLKAAAADKKRLVAEQRTHEEILKRRQQAEEKKREAERNKERILSPETMKLGVLRTAVYYRHLGFIGQKRSSEQNNWEFLPRYSNALAGASSKITDFPLQFDNYNAKPELKLYISQKRGLTIFSSLTSEISLKKDYQTVFSFSFSTDDSSFEGLSPKIIDQLRKELSKHSEIIGKIIAEHNQKEKDRVAKLKTSRETAHNDTMIKIRQMIQTKDYQGALDRISMVEKEGIHQSDSIGYVKALLLHELSRDIEAKKILDLYLAEYGESGSPYVIKAKLLLRTLESK